MKTTLITAALALSFAAFAGCNNVGDCPAASSVTPGGSCSTDNLQCPYTLPTSSGDDAGGTATSCICMGGMWSCPGTGEDGGTDAAEDTQSDSTVESGPDAQGRDVGPETTTEAAAEASPEASPEAAPEAAADVAPEASAEASSDAPGQ